MPINFKVLGGAVAAAVATGVGYMLVSKERAPGFRTVERDGAISVRDYPQLLVAEAIREGLRESALSRGFLALADYLGSRRRAGPVLADGDEDGRGWRTRFVMPAKVAPDSLPEPAEGIRVRSIEPRRIAALRFSGEATDDALDQREEQLRKWMRAHGLKPAGPVEHAFYTSPLAPAALQRSEVLIPLAA